MKTIRENIFNIIISTLLAAILATMWAMYDEYKQQPPKWEDNKQQHDRYEDLFIQEQQKVQELQVRVGILEHELK